MGVVIEVIPQELNEKGELIPADIRDPDKTVFNAAVLVRHPDGHLVKSVGTGTVDVFPRSEVRRKGGEREALRSVDKDGIYSAKCFEDLLMTIDTEGNTFDVTSSTADAKLAVSISGEEALESFERAQDILTSAAADPRNHVEVSDLQAPSRGLRVHTLYTPMPETPRPPFAEAPRPTQNGPIEVRHLEEFPPVTPEVWAEFREAYGRYQK